MMFKDTMKKLISGDDVTSSSSSADLHSSPADAPASRPLRRKVLVLFGAFFLLALGLAGYMLVGFF